MTPRVAYAVATISTTNKELPEAFGGKNFTFRGLVFDDVVTHRLHRRKGVATALFRAIEKDAYELVQKNGNMRRYVLWSARWEN